TAICCRSSPNLWATGLPCSSSSSSGTAHWASARATSRRSSRRWNVNKSGGETSRAGRLGSAVGTNTRPEAMMPYYRSVGNIPPKRHTQHRRPDGSLYFEELIGEEGFSSDSSLLYHTGVPSALVDARPWTLPEQSTTPN